MKLKNNFIKILAVSSLLSTAFWGCKKEIFDLVDHNGIDSRIWDDAGAVGQFLDKGYDLMMPQWPTPGAIHNTSDELNSANTVFLYGTLTDNSVTDIGTGNSVNTNRYYDIRRCNMAIDGLNGSLLTDDVKNPLKGQFFMLRAMTYYNIVRIYGGVPIVLHGQDVTDEELNVPRSKSSECIEQIVKDLDSAAMYLPKTWAAVDKGRLTKSAAMAFKGRVLLNWASPQFNVNNVDPKRWERAYTAYKAAYDTCVSHGVALYSSYANIFVVEDNSEVLIVRKHDAISVSPGRGTNTEYITRPRSETTAAAGGGSNQPTLNLVKAYLMSNGLPITHASSNYNDTLFWLNRDPRFAASISYNGDLWALSGKPTRKQWNYLGVVEEGSGLTATGFYCKKICNPAIAALQTQYNSNSGGGSGMDWVEMRFAEVVMGLAECANETGRTTEAKDMVRLIRKRAGIVAGSFDYGLSIVQPADIFAMRDLIINENQIEFAMEGKRYWDLRRTRRLHLLTGSVRQGIRWTPKTPYLAGTGTDVTKIYLDKPDANGIRPRDTANLNNISVYTKMFTVSLLSLDPTTPINIPQTYYFYPLPNFFKNSSYLIEQTQGWAGGSFDPLQ